MSRSLDQRTKARAARRGQPGRPSVAAFLALLALCFQCFIVQTHVEAAALAPAHAESVATLSAADASFAPGHGDEAPTICFLCQELALSGAFLQATPATFAPTEFALAYAAPSRIAQPPRIFPAHAWQSRAPPTSL